MDINVIRGLLTLLLLLVFVGICFWAYGSKRKADFSEAANLPLIDDNDTPDRSSTHSSGQSRGASK